jgi:hypothetical protein
MIKPIFDEFKLGELTLFITADLHSDEYGLGAEVVLARVEIARRKGKKTRMENRVNILGQLKLATEEAIEAHVLHNAENADEPGEEACCAFRYDY